MIEELNVPLGAMEYNTVGRTFVLLSRVEGALATADVVATLRFTVKEIDPSSGGLPSDMIIDLFWLAEKGLVSLDQGDLRLLTA